MRIRNDQEGMVLISPGMLRKVITRSENLLARAARKAGMPITVGSWVLVALENGFRMLVDSPASVEKAKNRGLCNDLYPDGLQQNAGSFQYRLAFSSCLRHAALDERLA